MLWALWQISKPVGISISNIWEKRTCSKPSTRYGWLIIASLSHGGEVFMELTLASFCVVHHLSVSCTISLASYSFNQCSSIFYIIIGFLLTLVLLPVPLLPYLFLLISIIPVSSQIQTILFVFNHSKTILKHTKSILNHIKI